MAASENEYVLSIPEAGALIGLGRSASYAAANSGDIPTIRAGKAKLVPKQRWLRIVNGEEHQPPRAQPPG